MISSVRPLVVCEQRAGESPRRPRLGPQPPQTSGSLLTISSGNACPALQGHARSCRSANSSQLLRVAVSGSLSPAENRRRCAMSVADSSSVKPTSTSRPSSSRLNECVAVRYWRSVSVKSHIPSSLAGVCRHEQQVKYRGPAEKLAVAGITSASWAAKPLERSNRSTVGWNETALRESRAELPIWGDTRSGSITKTG
jgi:hypothetical protein